MFDLGLTPMHYSCLFNMFIPLSSFFMWEPLGQWLMRFSMHRITYMRGMGIISLGSLSLVSFHFFHTITLVYVMSCVLRPPRGHDFTHCVWQLTHGWYLRLVGDYCLEHGGWGVMIWFTLWHTLFIKGGYLRWCDLHWGITHSSMTNFLRWCPALGHS